MGEPEAVGAESSENGEKVLSAGLWSRTFQAFSYRDFRLMWVGAFTSTTGTWMQMVAESWLVLEMTGSAFYLGLIGFLGQLPIILFTLIGGAVADRVDRRKLLLLSQFVQMTSAFILTGLVFLDLIQIWHFFALVFVIGTAQAFGGPAYQALVPNLVRREHLSNAIALNSIQFNLARVVGPLLAGAALASVGAAFCFLLNGLSFLAVILTLYMIRSSFRPEAPRQSVFRDIKQGLSFVRERPQLWQLSLLGFISTFCGVPVLTLLPVFAKDILEIGSIGYSTLMACSGAGSILGALLYASYAGEGRGGLTLRIQLAFAVLLILFANSNILYLSYLWLFLGGAALMALFASVSSLVQMATSEEMRGRVMSIFMLAFRGGMPLGNLTAGYLAAGLSAPTALTFGALLLGSVAAWFLLYGTAVKRIE